MFLKALGEYFNERVVVASLQKQVCPTGTSVDDMKVAARQRGSEFSGHGLSQNGGNGCASLSGLRPGTSEA